MKKQLAIFIILAGLPYLCLSQILTVKDITDLHPICGVSLKCSSTGITFFTNSQGQVDISGFMATDEIEISHPGYVAENLINADLQECGYIILLKVSVVNPDPNVFSDTRWDQPADEVPAQIIVFPERQVEFINPPTTADLLASSGEVFLQKNLMGGGNPCIRGYSSNRLVMEVDGIRMNTAVPHSACQQNLLGIDPFIIQKAEVIYGSSSVIYGSDAIAGALTFRTLNPEFSTGDDATLTGHAVTRYASANNEMTAHADVKIGWRKWASVTSLTFSDFGDLRMGKHGPEEYLSPFTVKRENGEDVVVENENPLEQIPSGYSQAYLLQKVRYRLNRNWEFTYGFYLASNSAIPRRDLLSAEDDGIPVFAEAFYGPQTWMLNSLQVNYNFPASICDRMNVRLAHQFLTENRTERGFDEPIRHNQQEKVNALYVSLDLIKCLAERHQIFYGIEVVYDDINSSGTDENLLNGDEETGPGNYPRSQWGSYALYLDYSGRISEKLSLQAGVRYNIYSLDAGFDSTVFHLPITAANINSDVMTGKAGIIYKPSGTWAFSSVISTGFRAPNVDDAGRIIESEPVTTLVPNPGLKEEYSYTIDFRAKKVFAEKLKAEVSIYYTYLQDALVRGSFSSSGTDSIISDATEGHLLTMENAAHACVYGIQAGIDGSMPHGLGFNARMNYQAGEEIVNNSPSYSMEGIAPFFGKAGISYQGKRLRAEVYTCFSGSVRHGKLSPEENARDYLYATDDNGNPYSPAWWTINVRAGYQVTSFLSVNIGAENLTDVRYRPYGWGITAAGRNILVSVRAGF